jgi:hypothetical protein
MAWNILSSDIFVKGVLPFLLVFVLVFAILERTRILGEGKKQINAIIALVIGLMLIAFTYPTGIITKLVPFVAVAVVIIFVFLLLYGFVASDNKEGLKLHKGIIIAAGIVIVIAVIIAVLWATDSLDYIKDAFTNENWGTSLLGSVLLIAAIIAAVAIVLTTSGKKE